jgi:hypothetical protein
LRRYRNSKQPLRKCSGLAMTAANSVGRCRRLVGRKGRCSPSP